MSCSRFEYVKQFERKDICLQNCFIVVRVDGISFHKFAEAHSFEKPNDFRALSLMNKAARAIIDVFRDIWIAYGTSDEFSFVFGRDTKYYNRRESKILSSIVSLFTSNYVFNWSEVMERPLKYTPSFDGRIILYPSIDNVRDYLSWRQADNHINNLYNTAFWALVQSAGYSRKDAEEKLSKSLSDDKRNNILFEMFGINYNDEPEQFRKGSILIREFDDNDFQSKWARAANRMNQQSINSVHRNKLKTKIALHHCDIIGDKFWDVRPWILI